MTSIQSMMMDRINLHNLKAFSSSDFLDLGNYKAVSKALEKLEDEGKTLRATAVLSTIVVLLSLNVTISSVT